MKSFSVTASTTHVISGEGKRTLNLLKGLMQVWQYLQICSHMYPFYILNSNPGLLVADEGVGLCFLGGGKVGGRGAL